MSASTIARMAIGLVAAYAPPQAAWAHVGTGLPGGFEAGFLHPFSGIDHLLAMVSVGLWGAFLGEPLLYLLPVIFPAMMAVGAIMGMLAVPMPPIDTGIAVSVLVLGGCIAFSLKAPVWLACLIVALFAVYHGYAHGRELPSAADPVSYSAGFVLATGLLHISGIGVGLLNRVPAGVVVTRTLGAVVATAGGWFLSRAIGV